MVQICKSIETTFAKCSEAMEHRNHFKNGASSNFPCYLIAICFAVLIVFSGCKKDDDNVPKITMTTEKSGYTWIGIAGSGDFTIDWGDGSEVETHTLLAYLDKWSNEHVYSHIYSNTSARIITITGKNITHLDCRPNQLTSLDVSKNTKLIYLSCYNNQLTNLNISKNTALKELYCYLNQLTSLVVSMNTELIELNCAENKLTSMDVSKNKKLTYLFCGGNPLTTLDVSNNKELTSLLCGRNQLTSLNLSNNTALKTLWCQYNHLTSLNVSSCTDLTELYCYENRLNNLNVNGCMMLTMLNCCFNELTADTLNALFGTLPENTIPDKLIDIRANPGTADCDRNIATNKGWFVSFL